MTLILTYVSKYGIIHASDSIVTNTHRPYPHETSLSTSSKKKVFAIPALNAGLTIAGAYNVGDQTMDTWMNNFIVQQSAIENLTLGEFANNLRSALERAFSSKSELVGSLIHVAGYVNNGIWSHPEFWLVTNIPGINKDGGKYLPAERTFNATEDFWNRDLRKDEMRADMESGGYQLYFNGFPPGRINYLYLHNEIQKLFSLIWSNSDWKFRRPKSLDEAEEIVKLEFQCINTLFECSDYDARPIGGETQTYKIQPSANVTFNYEMS